MKSKRMHKWVDGEIFKIHFNYIFQCVEEMLI